MNQETKLIQLINEIGVQTDKLDELNTEAVRSLILDSDEQLKTLEDIKKKVKDPSGLEWVEYVYQLYITLLDADRHLTERLEKARDEEARVAVKKMKLEDRLRSLRMAQKSL